MLINLSVIVLYNFYIYIFFIDTCSIQISGAYPPFLYITLVSGELFGGWVQVSEGEIVRNEVC